MRPSCRLKNKPRLANGKTFLVSPAYKSRKKQLADGSQVNETNETNLLQSNQVTRHHLENTLYY